MSKAQKVVVPVQGGSVRALLGKTVVMLLPLALLGVAVAIYSRRHHEVLVARQAS